MKDRMNKLLLFAMISILSYSNSLHAQVDVKIRPITVTTLFRNITLTADYALKENISLEAGVFFNLFHEIFPGKNSEKVNYFILDGRIKYYFNPQKGADKFYLATYAYHGDFYIEFDNMSPDYFERTAFGLQPGYKFIIKDKFVLDLGFQFGRAFTSQNGIFLKANNNDDPIYSLIINYDLWTVFKVGYRFTAVKHEK